MNSHRVAHAANEISRLMDALEWLRKYGGNLQHRDRDSFSLNITVATASACHGAKEAQAQLSSAARVCIKDVVAHAIKDAENTIEMHKSAIREELQATAPALATVSEGET